MKLSSENRIQELTIELGLHPHPEGGYYKETYRSSESTIFHGSEKIRNYLTDIYFLLLQNNFSGFHRIKSDELWNFYEGDPILVHCIHPNGEYKLFTLGNDLKAGMNFKATVTKGTWFASESVGKLGYGLCGCSVSPGFYFEDFEMAERYQLIELYPQHKEIITRLTRV